GAWEGSEPKSLAAGLLLTFTSAVDAVACAVGVQQGIERHNRRYPDERLETRVGLHVGESIVDEADYFGPDVVTARRVCESAVPGQILATEVVASLVGSRGQYRFADHGSLEVRGVSRPVTTHTVLWHMEKAIALPLPRAVAADHQPFVGRSDESDVLEAAWEESVARHRQAVLIGGEPGIGKTRLATEFALRAHGDGATVLWGRCDEELGVAYQPFAEALRQYVEVCPVEDLHAHVEAYGGMLARLVPEMELRLPELSVPAAGDAEADRYYLFEAATGLIGTATERAPVVLVVDDLHWAARPTMLMLRHLLRSQHAQALLVIATYRDTEIAGGHPLAELLADLRSVPDVHRLAMEGLGVHDLADLVEAKVAGRLASGRDVIDGGQRSVPAIDCEHSDVVGTAIGGIEKLARRMHFNFGGIIAAFKFLRKGRNCFEAAQRSSARVVAEFGNAPAHFIDDIDEPAVGMKYEMPGAGGWRDLAIGWIVGRQASLGGVELIDEQFVQAEISCERIAVISSQLNLVSVWALLALRIRTVSLVLYD